MSDASPPLAHTTRLQISSVLSSRAKLAPADRRLLQAVITRGTASAEQWWRLSQVLARYAGVSESKKARSK